MAPTFLIRVCVCTLGNSYRIRLESTEHAQRLLAKPHKRNALSRLDEVQIHPTESRCRNQISTAAERTLTTLGTELRESPNNELMLSPEATQHHDCHGSDLVSFEIDGIVSQGVSLRWHLCTAARETFLKEEATDERETTDATLYAQATTDLSGVWGRDLFEGWDSSAMRSNKSGRTTHARNQRDVPGKSC